MGSRPSLFEYLAVPVDPLLSGAPTRVTEEDGESYDQDEWLVAHALAKVDPTRMTSVEDETYDDSPGAETLSVPTSVLDSTIKSSIDGETYDGDPGLPAVPRSVLLDSTIETRTEPETYDDNPGTESMGISRTLVGETSFTKEDNETMDDDQGFGALSLPTS